ncbi:MAG: hypothetical protein EG823_06670 [Actinobacteria bacterium]|nr:hypothetical protein [Actinomycetota bacterium]
MRASKIVRVAVCVALVASFAVFSSPGVAGAGGTSWHWLNPEPTGDTLNAVSMSPETGSSCMWAVGNYGFIAKTFDYGQSWHKFDPTGMIGNPDLTDIDMLSNSVGWAVGTNGTIIKISEWWNTTVQTAPTGTGDLYAVDALNSTTAYAVGVNGTVIKTLDGTNWTTVQAGGLPGYGNFYAIQLLNNNQGWVAGVGNSGGNNIYFLTSGLLWNKSTADTDFDVQDIAVDPATNTLWAVGMKRSDGSALFYKTADANIQTQDNNPPLYAMTPPLSPSLASGYLTGISRPDATHILMTTSGGDIIYGDGSAAWTKKDSPYPAPARPLNDIDVHVNGTEYRTAVVGDHGVLAYTPNVAATTPTWTTRASATYQDLTSVDFISPAVGYVTAGKGVLKTADYGQTWSHLGADQGSALLDVDFKDASNGAAVGRSGGVYIYNGSWTTAPGLSPGRDMNSVCYLAFNNIWAAGAPGTIAHWDGTIVTESSDPDVTGGNWNSVDFFDASHGIAVGDAGKVVYTSDSGANWTAGDSGVTENIESVDMVSATVGYMVGDVSGTGVMCMRKTTNGGSSWTAMTPPVGLSWLDLESVSFADTNNGWIVGQTGTILRTSNGGASWTPENITSEWLVGVSAADANSACAVGYFGHVLANFYPPAKTTVYRFYNLKNGSHFYTDSHQEKLNILQKWPDIYKFEGVGYEYDATKATQLLYRFYNKINGSHFYTASAQEAENVIAKYSDIYQYDGPTYPVSPIKVTPGGTVYRFYNVKNGSHFYTASEDERNTVMVKWPNVFLYEGEAFYLPL